MFNPSEFRNRLQAQWLGAEFIYLEKADSTNSLLRKVPAAELVHGTVLLADHQLKGRGQFNRSWITEPYKNLTFTIALKPSSSDRISLLTPAAAWGIVRALQALYNEDFYIKWPNDLMVAGKKLGGILTECVFNGSKVDRVLIGIGLNVCQSDFPDELQNATSLFREFGERAGREQVLCSVLEHIELAYRRWRMRDKELVQDINRVVDGFGNWVTISVNGERQQEEMKFLGVDEKGHIVVLTPEIEVKKFTHEQIRIHPDD